MRHNLAADVVCVSVDVGPKLDQDGQPDLVWADLEVLMMVVGLDRGFDETVAGGVYTIGDDVGEGRRDDLGDSLISDTC